MRLTMSSGYDLNNAYALLNQMEGINALGANSTIDDILDSVKDFIVQVIASANNTVSGWIDSAKTSITQKVNNTQNYLTTVISNTKSNINDFLSGKIDLAKNTINSAVDTARSSLDSAISSSQAYISGAINTVYNNVTLTTDAIKNKISSVENTITSKIDNTIGDLGAAFRDAIGWVRDGIDNLVTGLENTANNIGLKISEGLANAGDFISAAVSGAVNGATQWVSDSIANTKDAIERLIVTLQEKYENATTSLGERINDVRDGITQGIENASQKIKDIYETGRTFVEEKIQEFLDWLRMLGEEFDKFMKQVGRNLLDWFGKNVMPAIYDIQKGGDYLISVGQDMWAKVSAGDYQGAFDTFDKFSTMLGLPDPVKAAWSIVSMLAYFQASVQIQFVPMQVAASKNANINLALDPVSLEAGATAFIKGKISKARFYDNARLAGVTQERADIVLESAKAMLSPGDIQTLFLRGEINESEHDKMLGAFGFSKDDIKLFKTLYHVIPTPNDLITMAVREVFSPETAEKFGQFEDFPEVFAYWAEKQGLSAEWARNYWAAHWDLPSPQMGFEMLHRRIIDDQELSMLLKALDVMPFWREKLIEMSYSPLTRVDVRRMYKVGVLSEQQVFESYLDQGYNEENARNLTEFTKRYSAPEDQSELDAFRDLARSSYSQAYRKNILSREEYEQFLLEMGYQIEDVNLLISIDEFNMSQAEELFDLQGYRKDWLKILLSAYDKGLIGDEDLIPALQELGYTDQQIALEKNLLSYNRQMTLRNLIIKQVGSMYVDWIIGDEQVREKLGMFTFTTGEIDTLLIEWSIERDLRTKRPTMTELKKFLTEGLLSLDEFLDEVRGTGMNEKYIPMFAKMFAQ